MSEGNIEKPLLLNESMKDSIEQAPPQHQSPPVQPIHEEVVELDQDDPPNQSPAAQSLSQPGKTEPPERIIQQQIEPIVEVQPQMSGHKPGRGQDLVESLISEAQIGRVKGSRRYRVLQVCGFVCVLIGIVLVFGIPPLIQHIIVSKAIDQVIMRPDNQKIWAHFPGDTETIITRNFTFFNLTNEDNFLIRQQKPIFQEISGFKIQELEDFLDIQYLEDGNKVKVRDWVRFSEWSQSKDLDSKVSILNMGSLGYWSTLKTARPTLILQQGLALLFSNLEQSILPTLIGTGINNQFLPSKAAAVNSLFLPAGIEQGNHDFLWNDPSFGMSSPDNLGEWAAAAMESFSDEDHSYQFSSKANNLKNYFVFSDSQLQALMNKFDEYIANLRHILIDNHYCAEVARQNCTGRYLAIGQMTDGWVTAFPPPVASITPNDTICDNNSTCKSFYPELYSFSKNLYLGSKSSKGINIPFNRSTVLGWLDYNKSVEVGKKYNTAEDCLLHIGNLDQVWQWGTQYNQAIDPDGMKKIAKRLHLVNETQAELVWAWLQYLHQDFVLQQQNNQRLGVANLFSQGLYQQLSLTMDTLQPLLLTKMLNNRLQNIQCHQFFSATLEETLNSTLVKQLCQKYKDIHTEQFAKFMVNTCQQKYGPSWQELRNQSVSLLSMQHHCQINGKDNIGNMLHKIKLQLDQHYNCSSTPNPYCSNFELAAMQWANSSVTKRPPLQLADDLPECSSYSKWNNDVRPFEYSYYLDKLTPEKRVVFDNYTLGQLFKTLTFEEWFSAPVILRFIKDRPNDHFVQYIRWFGISVTLNGLTTTRTVRQILFGYDDQFLTAIKDTYPPFGGDPSTPARIALNDLNLTEAEATQTVIFETGKEDYRKVYQNYQINGYRYSVNNYSWFDGNETKWGWKSPWAEEDHFYGTTAKIFSPNQFEVDNLSLLIPQLQRYGSNSFYRETFKQKRFGQDVYMSYLNAKLGQVCPENNKYYQSLPNVFNASSIYGLPLYITKNHFMNCTEWLDKVDIYNQDLSILYKQISHWDDTWVLVEPYTGVSFQSNIYLQNNYLQKPDELLTYQTPTLLPIFSINRAGNLTENKYHELYDPMITGFKVKKGARIVGIVVVLVFLAVFTIATHCIRKKAKTPPNERVSSQLGSSVAVE